MTYRDFISRPDRGPAVVAHRGAWRTAPENSLAAIESAIAIGCPIVEIDIRQSRDGGLYLMHDSTLERMTGRADPLEALTADELAAIRLRQGRGGSGTDRTDHSIPTLAQALATARGRVFFDLDVKRTELIGTVAAMVGANGDSDRVAVKKPVATRADADSLSEAGREHGIMTMPIVDFTADTAAELLGLVDTLQPPIVEAAFDAFETLDSVAGALRERGIAIWINTLDGVASGGYSDSAALADPDAIWGRLLDCGVSVIQTDEPEALTAFLGNGGARRTNA